MFAIAPTLFWAKIVDLEKVGVAGRGSGIGCGHGNLKFTINEIPFYYLYLSN